MARHVEPLRRQTLLQAVAFALILFAGLLADTTQALEIELLDTAPDRVERQRAYVRGAMPLPSTPDLARLDQRLQARGLAKGSPIHIRIFKASSELELWMRKEDAYVLLDTYPICHWTGSLGPKLREGDKQSPEGFYTVTSHQMRRVGRWEKAFNLGYPNAFDQLNKRTGSYILVHGGCSSTGCFAMTDAVQDEIYGLAQAAQARGHARFDVHVFPFRMTDDSMAEHQGKAWSDFWRDLKAAYDSFERTRLPPTVAVCGQRYHVADGTPAKVDTLPPPRLRIPLLRAAAAATTASNVADAACIPVDRETRHEAARAGRQKASARNRGKSGPHGFGDQLEPNSPRVITSGG